MTESVLYSKYVEPTRPYSINELNDMRNGFMHRLKLSDVYVHHKKCHHTYMVKYGGDKYNDLTSGNEIDDNTCSVCWKLKSLKKYSNNKHLYNRAMDVISLYNRLKHSPKYTYDAYDIDYVYHTWIYS